MSTLVKWRLFLFFLFLLLFLRWRLRLCGRALRGRSLSIRCRRRSRSLLTFRRRRRLLRSGLLWTAGLRTAFGTSVRLRRRRPVGARRRLSRTIRLRPIGRCRLVRLDSRWLSRRWSIGGLIRLGTIVRLRSRTVGWCRIRRAGTLFVLSRLVCWSIGGLIRLGTIARLGSRTVTGCRIRRTRTFVLSRAGSLGDWQVGLSGDSAGFAEHHSER